MSQPLAVDVEVSKTFGGTKALDRVVLQVAGGTVHGLLGANGSGKSTLIKVLTGYHAPDPGARIALWGQEVEGRVRAASCGVAVVNQDLGLLDSGTVLENVGVGVGYGAGVMGRVSWSRERALVEGIMERLGADIDPLAKVVDLEPAERTFVAIARALRELHEAPAGRQVLILDEPTVYLTPDEVERLFVAVRRVVSGHGAAVFVTHRLDEALAACDDLTVLRDGQVAHRSRASESTVADLIEQIHGHHVQQATDALEAELKRDYGSASAETTAMELRHLTAAGLEDISLQVPSGSVLGVTGLAGMGQDVLPLVLSGLQRPASGQIHVRGRPVAGGPPAFLGADVVLVPANRQRDAVWTEASLAENFSLGHEKRHFTGRWLRRSAEEGDVVKAIRDYAVKAGNPRDKMHTLSGGNQQKLVVARALARKPTVLLLHEPFVGVDAAAREYIAALVRTVSTAGCTVIIFSVEYELLAEVADSVAILRHGRLEAVLGGSQVTHAAISAAVQGEALAS